MNKAKKTANIGPWFGWVAFTITILLILYVSIGIWLRSQDQTGPTIQLLVQILNESKNDQLRAVAARALGKMGDESVIEPLANAYESDLSIRREVILALKDLGLNPSDIVQLSKNTSPSVMGDLINSWKKEAQTFEPQTYLISALIRSVGLGFGFYIISSLILYILNRSRRALISISAVLMLTILASQAWIRYTPLSYNEPKIGERTAKLMMIALAEETDDKSAVPDLIKILEDQREDSELRIKSVDALGAIGDLRARPILQSIVNNSTETDRLKISVIWALGNILANEDKRDEHFDYLVFLQSQIEVYDELIAVDPTDYYAYTGRGLAHSDLGEYSQAIADFDKAILYNPFFGKVYYQRGLVNILKGEWEKAIADFTKAKEFGFVTADLYCQRGNAYMSSGRTNSAIDDFNSCLKLDFKKSEAHFSLGMAYRLLGKSEKAVLEFENYLKESPNVPEYQQVEKWIEELKRNFP
jgi:tetratricopeptide (TPR) repeat protein